MKILVTGGAGFIGSQIVDAYIEAGHEVTVLDDLSTGKKKNINSKAKFVASDVRDPNISTLFAQERFEIVNHLAAQLDVRKSMMDPFFDASVNILGTLRLLECSRSYGVRKFIFSSSGGTIYGECKVPAKEGDAHKPESPYGFSKAAAERYIQFYGDTFRLPYTILRYSNVYGPRQDPHGEAGVVAIFAGKLLKGEPVTIYGDGGQERDYVYVKDVVQANSQALTNGENNIINIATGVPTTVNTLYETMAKIQGVKPSPTFAPARAGELKRSVISAELAKKVLKWKPAASLETGLRETIQFFQKQS